MKIILLVAFVLVLESEFKKNTFAEPFSAAKETLGSEEETELMAPFLKWDPNQLIKVFGFDEAKPPCVINMKEFIALSPILRVRCLETSRVVRDVPSLDNKYKCLKIKNGHVDYCGKYENGRPQDEWVYYSADKNNPKKQNKSVVMQFSVGVFDGCVAVYDKNEKLVEVRRYTKGSEIHDDYCSKSMKAVKTDPLTKVKIEPNKFGYVSISTAPTADAIIIINGKRWLIKTPFERFQVPIGTYDVRLRNELLGVMKTITIVVKEDQQVRVEETLKIKNNPSTKENYSFNNNPAFEEEQKTNK